MWRAKPRSEGMAPPGDANMMVPTGPPYRPRVWALGGIPSKGIDIPVTAVFLFLFMCGAAAHMTIFQLNKRRGHKFLPNVFLFGFCMARIVTTVLRIASTSLPSNTNLAIAASIFTAAGVLIIFVINLIFAQRVLRSLHPHIGWYPAVAIVFRVIYVLVVFTLIIVITATVQTFFTLRPRTRTIDRDLQLFGITFLTIVSFLPILIVVISLVLPRRTEPDRFGQGRFRTKVTALLIGSFLACLGAVYRCGTSWKHPVPLTEPQPAYFSRACYYIFNFTVEILVVYLYAAIRVDRRFHIPNGAKGPGSYAAGSHAADSQAALATLVGSDLEENKAELERPGSEKSEPEKPELEKSDPEKAEPEKLEPEKSEPKKPVSEKSEPEKPEPERPEPEKPESEKSEQKPEPEKAEPEKAEPEKPPPKTSEQETLQPEKPEPERPEQEKLEQKPEPEKVEPEKPQPETSEQETLQPEKPEPEKPEPEKPEPETSEPEKPEPEKPEPEKPEPEKPEPEKPEPETSEQEKPEQQTLQPEKAEPERPGPEKT